jgi:hypothetical protein
VLELHPYFLPLGFVGGGAPMGAGPFLPLPLALALEVLALAAFPFPPPLVLFALSGGAAASMIATGSAGPRLRRNTSPAE